MLNIPHEHNTTLVWEDGGVSAPVEMWIQEIILALPADMQAQVLDRITARVEEINAEIAAEKYDGEGVA